MLQGPMSVTCCRLRKNIHAYISEDSPQPPQASYSPSCCAAVLNSYRRLLSGSTHRFPPVHLICRRWDANPVRHRHKQVSPIYATSFCKPTSNLRGGVSSSSAGRGLRLAQRRRCVRRRSATSVARNSPRRREEKCIKNITLD